jgi:hypothetical protein
MLACVAGLEVVVRRRRVVAIRVRGWTWMRACHARGELRHVQTAVVVWEVAEEGRRLIGSGGSSPWYERSGEWTIRQADMGRATVWGGRRWNLWLEHPVDTNVDTAERG